MKKRVNLIFEWQYGLFYDNFLLSYQIILKLYYDYNGHIYDNHNIYIRKLSLISPLQVRECISQRPAFLRSILKSELDPGGKQGI